MNCLKCGREIDEGQVFCLECIEVMHKYPVKPGIAIQLPRRTETPLLKKVYPKRRQPPTMEEQIRILKRRIRRLAILWLITLALLAATVYPAVEYFLRQDILLPGQNYSTFSDADSTSP